MTFAAVTAITPTGDGRFEAGVSPEWTIGGKPNGGYLLGILGRAAAAVSVHDDVIAASAHYLHSPEPGPVTVHAEVLRAGRTASQVRARIAQGDQPCVEALVTVGRLDPEAKPYWDGGAPDPGDGSYEDATRLPGRMPSGVRVAILDQVSVRFDPESLQCLLGQPSGRGELRGWLTLPDGEDFDPVSLLYAVDSFPPATFDVEFSGWVPTLELTAYVRALPVPGPLRVLQRAHLIDGQRVDETCFVWDRTGRLVAQGTQLAGIRLG